MNLIYKKFKKKKRQDGSFVAVMTKRCQYPNVGPLYQQIVNDLEKNIN